MSGKVIAKEELICMLSEIYDQLEELENVIGLSISATRKNMQTDHSAKLVHCEQRISTIETHSAISEASVEENVKNNRNRRKSMKPELGVLLPVNLR